MSTGSFYFLKDDYFTDFSDPKLMKNKEAVNGVLHGRPSFFAFYDNVTNLYWLVPFSSQVQKFKRIYTDKVNKYGRCDTIVFGKVLGHEKAFLIQNMCPVSANYLSNKYLDKKTGSCVRVDGVLESEIISKSRKVLALYRKGIRLILPDVQAIEKALIEKMNP